MAAVTTKAVTEAVTAAAAEGGILDVLSESHVGRTAVCKQTGEILTRSAPWTVDKTGCEENFGVFRYGQGDVWNKSPTSGSQQKSDLQHKSNEQCSIVPHEADYDSRGSGDNQELFAWQDNDDIESQGKGVEGASADEHVIVASEGNGTETCECVVCNRNGDNERVCDGSNENTTRTAVAAEKGEMAQCARHGISSPSTVITSSTWMNTRTKSSCFVILCKTCAKQIFHFSPSSSLCVHGRRRGRRNSTSTSSIRQEDVVSEASQAAVEKGPHVAVFENDDSGFNQCPKFTVCCGDRKCISARSKSDSKSVLCFSALRRLLAKNGQDLVLFEGENSSDAKLIIESLISILRTRKSFRNSTETAAENYDPILLAESLQTKGSKFSLNGPESDGEVVCKVAENQSLVVNGSEKPAEGSCCVNCKENEVYNKNIRVENGLHFDECPVCTISCSENWSSTLRYNSNLTKSVSEPLLSDTSKERFKLSGAFFRENLVRHSSDVGCKPQPAPIRKDKFNEKEGLTGDSASKLSSFVASNRLKRLEEHFKFIFTKKLLKDESLISVTDSDFSNHSSQSCSPRGVEAVGTESVKAFCDLPPRETTSSRIFNGDYSPSAHGEPSDSQIYSGQGTSCTNQRKGFAPEDVSSARTRSVHIDNERALESKQDISCCLQVPGKRHTSSSIHSSLSSSTGPFENDIRLESDLQIDRRYTNLVTNSKSPSQQVHSDISAERCDENGLQKEIATRQAETSQESKRPTEQRTLCYLSTEHIPNRDSGRVKGASPQQSNESHIPGISGTLRHANEKFDSQDHNRSKNNEPSNDDTGCTRSLNGFLDKTENFAFKNPPPPLPPRSPRSSRQQISVKHGCTSSKLLSENNYHYDRSCSAKSQLQAEFDASACGKNILNNNNVSHSDCASTSRKSSNFSLPTLSQNLPRTDTEEVSCCEFDVRYVHSFKDFNLNFECYDEFGVENCCERNYCYIGNDSFLPAAPSSSSGSLSSVPCAAPTPQRSVIEAVPLFRNQCQCIQSHRYQPSHHFSRHCLHHCDVGCENEDTMRELNGQLRGLLKKPNRPPPARKNRVVFDETRNEFFEADYIILIREDCAYDEEDEEPCTCGEHELVRLCCEEGCQCNYGEENVTPQSPKYAPPIEFVDEAALSPPDGYKDNGLSALSGALSGHVFGAQHIQQLQVIQRLQQQRAAMLAARASNQQNQTGQQTQQQQQQAQQSQQVAPSPGDDGQMTVCTECAECVECAAKQLQDEECVAVSFPEEIAPLSVPHVALVPLHNNSPERRITQKEIIAGEERPKYIAATQLKEPEDEGMEKILNVHKNQRYVVETITMTTVTERRIVRESTEDVTTVKSSGSSSSAVPVTTTEVSSKKPPIPAKPENLTSQISGILKGGKLWKNEIQPDEPTHSTSDEDNNAKRSVRFITEGAKDSSKEESECQSQSREKTSTEEPINELIPLKKHSTLFHNVLRPNSAVRQLFPAGIHPGAGPTALTHEALKAFEESKRGGLVSNLLTVGGGSDTDTIRRTIERNALRRSLIKKKSMKNDISLEERIKQLTCDIDEPTENATDDRNSSNANLHHSDDLDRRDSPAGEENPSQAKYIPDKSFSPSSSASSSSSGSTSAYRKISDIFNRDRRQEKIPEAEENPIVIIPQECRCPAAPDLGMGIQVPAAHTQIHQTPPRQSEPRRQFLSTLAPLTACVAGQKDDFSYYTLAAADRNSTASAQCAEYNLADIEATLSKDESRKVAPDVIAGTPGQEQDELVIFAQQEANRTDKIKKRYSNEHQNQTPASNVSSDDDEQNDYGFNKRPAVRGIKSKFETNEIIEEMQAQLSQPMPSQQQNATKPFNALKATNSIGSTNKPQSQVQSQPNSNNMPQNAAERAQWGYYNDEQRADMIQHPQYYQALPAQFNQTFHEESLMYQNCQSVSMEHHYGRFARSPSRRPESPPPLRNYHQTMVLIPYNTQSYAQFSSLNDQQTSAGQFRRQNVLEYQQVTQQTIRLPIGYSLPGMQLHLVAGRGVQHQHVQYSQSPRLVAPRNFNIPQQGHDANNMKFGERGIPEGSAATSHSDFKNVMSPTSAQAGQDQCNQTSQVSPAVPGAVFYAMNV